MSNDVILLTVFGGMFLVFMACLWIILRPMNKIIQNLKETEQELRRIAATDDEGK
jgi:cbb3-type cytochrome oxidase subunit 3